jgi:hypothetical protein
VIIWLDGSRIPRLGQIASEADAGGFAVVPAALRFGGMAAGRTVLAISGKVAWCAVETLA